MTTPHFMPPFLRWNIPNEKIEIEKQIALEKAKLQPEGKPKPNIDLNSVQVSSGLLPGALAGATALSDASIATGTTPIRKGVRAKTSKVAVTGGTAGPEQSASATSIKKIASVSCTVTPNGNVQAGWYCPCEFKAEVKNIPWTLIPDNYTCSWTLVMGAEKFFLGTKKGSPEIFFTIDAPTYNTGSLNQVTAQKQFRVECLVLVAGPSPYSTVSDQVTVLFNTAIPCIALNAFWFPEEQWSSEAHLVGDNHEQRPKIEIGLTGPAGPSGQQVFVELNDPYWPAVGRFFDNVTSFTIPPGQSIGQWEGFLGTRSVASDKTLGLRVRVNGQYSGWLPVKVTRN